MSLQLKQQRFVLLFLITLTCIEQVSGDSESIGPNGINSAGLGYTGAGISIGQVEPERPGTPEIDDANNSNFFTVPKEVFLLNGNPAPTPNAQDEIYFINPPDPPHPHATYIAGVMISSDTFAPGVARNADLYASTVTFRSENPVIDTDELATQFIALHDSGNVRAINISYLRPFDPGGVPNGNSKFTQFIDWSAGMHDVLYVVAGREGSMSTSVGQPADNFNGITVAFSTKSGGAGKFREVDSFNNFVGDAFGPRTSIDILAPGRDIMVPALGGGNPPTQFGTSLAAPHVTGTVAPFAAARR
jgi:subtilisin family serine protease